MVETCLRLRAASVPGSPARKRRRGSSGAGQPPCLQAAERLLGAATAAVAQRRLRALDAAEAEARAAVEGAAGEDPSGLRREALRAAAIVRAQERRVLSAVLP